ncbi:unnamed protein product, partial [Oppiella nova]
SAFVDKYSHLGEDVITLFSNESVYELTVSPHNLDIRFRYDSTKTLGEWSLGIMGPINVVNYDVTANYLTLENYVKEINWTVWYKNKAIKDVYALEGVSPDWHNYISFERLTTDNMSLILDKYVLRTHPDPQIDFKRYIDGQLHSEYKNLIVFEIPNLNDTLDYLRGTTAGFLYDNRMYIMAGHRICSINLITNYWTEECLPQTIAEWVGCDDYRHNTDDNQMVVDIPDADVMGPTQGQSTTTNDFKPH